MPDARALERAAVRVRALAEGYKPPSFDHVPDPDSALFLCAVDHRTGYREDHLVDVDGPFGGSELLWAMALSAAARKPGLLTARALADVSAHEVADIFRADGETVEDPERRAGLWEDLAQGLERDHSGSAAALLDSCGRCLAGPGGLLAQLSGYEAYGDPLAKKSFLFAKIAERRGWLRVADPESWEMCADNVLMRIALRSGLVVPGPLEAVRAATRDALKRLAAETGLSPPLLDDLLWERGRDEPNLLGADAGDLREPERDPASHWY